MLEYAYQCKDLDSMPLDQIHPLCQVLEKKQLPTKKPLETQEAYGTKATLGIYLTRSKEIKKYV